MQGDEWKCHTPCYGKTAASAAIYPFKLCRAILEGFVKEMQERARWDAHAKLVLPASHAVETSPSIEEELPEVFNKVADLLI